MKRIKEKEFPAVVLEVLQELEKENNPQLTYMQKMTLDKNEFKEMWLSILRAPRREMYCPEKDIFFQPTDKDIVYAFLKSAIVHSREEIPVFYLNKKEKKAEINKIRNAEKKLVAVYKDPETIVKWARETLPIPFKRASCYYKFSASQNVGKEATASLHLWFWLEQAVSDGELKRYFHANPAPIDMALFNPVQIHYTARPLFDGMDDPLPKRSGVLVSDHDSVPLLDIPPETVKATKPRPEKEPEVSDENRAKALDLLLPYYKEGKRDRFCGAIAGTLYREGWNAENVADFVHELALKAQDDESGARYNGALRICNGLPIARTMDLAA